MDNVTNITPEQRRATTEALKIARRVDHGRVVLRSLIVTGGRAFVTDSYSLVVLPWLDGMPDGCYDADDMYQALKGAGRECARIVVKDESAEVIRFVPLPGRDTERRIGEHPDELGQSVRGVFPVRLVEGTPPNALTIFDDAVKATTEDGYQASPMPFNPDLLAHIVKCHPAYFNKGVAPVTVRPRELKPAVVENGKPFGILMPMRTS